MSYFNTRDPECRQEDYPKYMNLEMIPRSVDLGGFKVERVLPSTEKHAIGPFVFCDQAGPGKFLTGKGLDVRLHPHFCLCSMIYLFQDR